MPDEKEKIQERRIVSSSFLSAEGMMGEMIIPQEGGGTTFIVIMGQSLESCESCTDQAGNRHIPFGRHNSLLIHRVILFPSGAEPYESESDLLSSVRSFIHRYADLSPAFEEAASLYVLLSWVYDAYRELPYLRFKGDFGTGKSRCLQVIGSLCYKPMFASGASTVSPLFRIIDTFRGTLVMDEGDFRFSDEKAELVKILNNGNAAGFPVLRSESTPTKEFNPRAFVVFGPKVIATRNLFEDRALESRCITEVMTGFPPRTDIPLSLPESFEEEATALRNQLLTYRFRNLAVKRQAGVPEMPGCEPRIAQVYGPLAAVAPTEEGKARVLTLAQDVSAKLRNERGTTVEAQLLGILHALWKAGEPLAIKAIASRFTEEHGEDFRRPVTPRWIGHQLRSRFGFSPIKSNGTYIVGPEDHQKLYSFFTRYMVGSSADFGDIGDINREG